MRSWPTTTSVSSSGKRIQKDMADFNSQPPLVALLPPNAIISTTGSPPSSVHKAIFFLDITYKSDYPSKPPKVIFKTRIYHCDVDVAGKHFKRYIAHQYLTDRDMHDKIAKLYSIFTRQLRAVAV
ncbi:hypothetical protein AMTRI_Chr03g50740 [Amborella trichopoda]